MSIRIDELPTTVLQSRSHKLPAMLDGLTVQLTVAQILELIEKPDFISLFNAGDVVFTPVGTIAATDVQGALAELGAEKLPISGASVDLSMNGKQILDLASLNGGPLGGFRDAIINGDGVINQRSYTTVADDVYWCDRHYALTQTAAITPTIIADVANGLPSMMRLSQSQATAQRMGNAQIVEALVSKRFRGKQVTLGGHLRCSASQPIRYAVLEWTGAADAVTSDVVNSWTNGSFTPGQFFLTSNLAVAAIGSITPAANAVTPWSLIANISGACNNLVVFMWTEGTAAQNVTLDMVWGLVQGDATKETWPYAPRHNQQESALCWRYYQRLVSISVQGYCVSAAAWDALASYVVPEMRAVPAISYAVSTSPGVASGPTTTGNTASTLKMNIVSQAISGLFYWMGTVTRDSEL